MYGSYWQATDCAAATLYLQTNGGTPMTGADYRAMASEIRDLIPLLLHAQSVADLRLLADRYERLAHDLQTVHGTLPDRLLEHRRQAS